MIDPSWLESGNIVIAGSIGHVDVITQAVDVREKTLHNFYDNTPTVFWQRKGSATMTSLAAYLL